MKYMDLGVIVVAVFVMVEIIMKVFEATNNQFYIKLILGVLLGLYGGLVSLMTLKYVREVKGKEELAKKLEGERK